MLTSLRDAAEDARLERGQQQGPACLQAPDEMEGARAGWPRFLTSLEQVLARRE